MKLFDILTKTPSDSSEPLLKSKSEGRRLILNKGVKLNNFTVIDSDADVFFHEGKWLLVEKNRLTVIDTVYGTIESANVTQEQHKECTGSTT